MSLRVAFFSFLQHDTGKVNFAIRPRAIPVTDQSTTARVNRTNRINGSLEHALAKYGLDDGKEVIDTESKLDLLSIGK